MGLKSLLLGTILSGILLFSYIFPFPVYAIDDITTDWSVGGELPVGMASQSSYTSENRIYVLGGANTIDFLDITYSDVDSDGNLSSWISQDITLPQTRYWSASTSNGKYVHLVGGASLQEPGIFTDTVYRGELDIGEISGWTAQTPLPKKLGLGAVVISGDNMYFSGGFNNLETSNKVYKAPLDTDGSVGSWVEVGVLPVAVFGHGMVEDNGNIYIFGGYAGNSQDKVYRATINPDGTLSSWTEEFPLPHGLYRPGIMKVGKTILSVGGDNNGVSVDKIYFTEINPDGSLGSWQESSHKLPAGVHGGTLALVNEYLYLIGGYRSGVGYLSSVYYTKLDTDVASPEIALSVPTFMQTDSAWGGHIYDSAHLWSPSTPTISAWGCAMTSAAMVFNYHKITKLPNNLDLNPGNLNAWLKAQPDGYVGSGWVNWIALSRLSKQAKSKNPSFTYDALEFKRVNGYNPVLLKTDLENNIPGILEVPGHFVVGKGTLGGSFTINDPFYSDRATLSSYSDSFLTLNRFVPSNTDLSYMVFIVEDGATVVVRDENGDIVGEGFTQQPLNEDEGSGKSGSPMYMYYIPQPQNGDFTIELSGNKPYSLQSFFYDINAEVKKQVSNGVVVNNKKDLYSVSFNKQSVSSIVVTEKVSFDNLSIDLEYFYSVKKLKNKGIYLALSEKVTQAKHFSEKNKKVAKNIMNSFLSQLEGNRKSSVSEDAYKILKLQAQTLYKSL